MQLHLARLCLDCEDIHEASACPLCASESWIYLSRWIPRERRSGASSGDRFAPPLRVSRKAAATYGIAGVAVAGALEWARRRRKRFQAYAQSRTSGDLR